MVEKASENKDIGKNIQEEEKDQHPQNQGTEKVNNKVEEEKKKDSAGKSKSSKKKKGKSAQVDIEKYENEIQELKEKYLRLSAEFDNYRKRTLKEKSDLLKSAGESSIVKILPVVDDFERAMASMNDARDIDAVKDGILLIYNKLKESLSQQGLKEIPAIGEEFNTDVHEAITKIKAPEDKLKGKIVDVVEKGYFLNEKVIRFAKVIIGE